MTTPTETTTPAELREALTSLAHRASREMPVVGSETMPTAWDLRHEAVNRLLDELEATT